MKVNQVVKRLLLTGVVVSFLTSGLAYAGPIKPRPKGKKAATHTTRQVKKSAKKSRTTKHSSSAPAKTTLSAHTGITVSRTSRSAMRDLSESRPTTTNLTETVSKLAQEAAPRKMPEIQNAEHYPLLSRLLNDWQDWERMVLQMENIGTPIPLDPQNHAAAMAQTSHLLNKCLSQPEILAYLLESKDPYMQEFFNKASWWVNLMDRAIEHRETTKSAMVLLDHLPSEGVPDMEGARLLVDVLNGTLPLTVAEKMIEVGFDVNGALKGGIYYGQLLDEGYTFLREHGADPKVAYADNPKLAQLMIAVEKHPGIIQTAYGVPVSPRWLVEQPQSEIEYLWQKCNLLGWLE